MKKKLIPIILALCCALCCAFSLAACADTNEITGFTVAKTGEEPDGEELNINITYGEKPELYKLYASYKNGDKKEIPFTDENLTVKYYYSEDYGAELIGFPTNILSVRTLSSTRISTENRIRGFISSST